MGRTVLIRQRARRYKHINQLTIEMQLCLSVPFIPVFSHACASPNHIDPFHFLPSERLGSHPIISLLQSQNVLPLDPRKCPTSLGQDF